MTVKLIPKYVNLSCALRVVHDHLIGWDKLTGNYLNDSIDMKTFPYGLPVTGEGGSEMIEKSFQKSNKDTLGLGASANSDATRGTQHGAMPSIMTSSWKGWPSGTPLFAKPAHNSSNAEALYANSNGYIVTLVHIPTGMKINFKAFLTGMSDNFSLSWESENLYGRNDPVRIYQGTTRSVNLSWDLVAASVEEGIENLKKCTMFSKILYPVYESPGSAASIIAPPMIAVKFTNLVSQGPAGADDHRGLTGTLSGFTFAPNLDAGWFEYEEPEE